MWTYNQTDELYHFGIPGMKWGVRRFQNRNTSSGKRVKKIKNKKTNSSSKKKKVINKKRLIAIGAIVTSGYLALHGLDKLLDMREEARIAKQYPIETINGLSVSADYAKYYMDNFKRMHGGG